MHKFQDLSFKFKLAVARAYIRGTFNFFIRYMIVIVLCTIGFPCLFAFNSQERSELYVAVKNILSFKTLTEFYKNPLLKFKCADCNKPTKVYLNSIYENGDIEPKCYKHREFTKEIKADFEDNLMITCSDIFTISEEVHSIVENKLYRLYNANEYAPELLQVSYKLSDIASKMARDYEGLKARY